MIKQWIPLSLPVPPTTSTPRLTPPTVPTCPGDKVYTTCGSACPATCDNLGNPRICIALCVPGCFCPSGTVELGDRCVKREECPNICTLPPVTGPCRAAFRRYFYNSTSGQCESFIYGGCLGNDNNFKTQKACATQCTSESSMHTIWNGVRAWDRGKIHVIIIMNGHI